MSLIARYGPCVGITLFRWRRWKVELWYAPANYATPEHSHNESHGEFTILWARNRRIYRKVKTPQGERVDEYIASTPRFWGKFLSVPMGVVHAFEKGDSCMVWICVETWKRGVTVTSVATDFHLANSD